MPEASFTTTPQATTEGNVLLIEVPERVLRSLSEDKTRVPVTVTINGYSYPTTIAVYGGKYYVPARREVRESARIEPGKRLTVRIALDTAARTVPVPPDLAQELAKDRAAKAFFDGLALSHRREYASWIAAAKREETRAERVKRTMAALRAGKKEYRS